MKNDKRNCVCIGGEHDGNESVCPNMGKPTPTRHPDAIIGAIREVAEQRIKAGTRSEHAIAQGYAPMAPETFGYERIANELIPELQAALLQQRLEDSLKLREILNGIDGVLAKAEAQS